MTTLKDKLCSMLKEKIEPHGYDQAEVIYLQTQEEVEELAESVIQVIRQYLLEDE